MDMAQLLQAILTARDIPPAVRDLDAPARHLYASLICHAQPTPAGLEAAVTVSDLCMATGLSDRTVRRYLIVLQNAGLLSCICDEDKPTRYRILYPDPGQDDRGHTDRTITHHDQSSRGNSDLAYAHPGQTDRGHHDPGHSDTPPLRRYP